MTEVLDAQRGRIDARQAELESSAAMARNRVVLFKAFGGGWSSMGQLAADPSRQAFKITD